jgi:prepilin-type N-terminal cleavage/methylation domain-containing protein
MKTRRSERGFSLIELMIVLTIMSLLVRLSIPAFDAIRRDSLASRAAGDLAAVRAAAVAQFEATGSYAPDAVGGVTPVGMQPFLPRNFSFRPVGYELDWENYAVQDPTQGPGGMGQILALTVTPDDPRCAGQVVHVLGGNCTHWSVGNSHTFVLFSTLEAAR